MFFFFFKQKTAYEMLRSLVGSEMCIRDRSNAMRRREFLTGTTALSAGSILGAPRIVRAQVKLSLIHI